jgi:hypothetical protein
MCWDCTKISFVFSAAPRGFAIRVRSSRLWRCRRPPSTTVPSRGPLPHGGRICFPHRGEPENQPFVDGNKRAGLNAALVFLDENGWIVRDPDMRLYDAMIAISSRALDKHGLALLLRERALPDDDEQG